MKPEHILDRSGRPVDFVRFLDVPVFDPESAARSGSVARSAYRAWGKRAFDILFTLAIAPLVVPLALALAALIALDGHNPFYAQRRIGLNGSVFRMWKLRSMVPGAEAALDVYLEENPAARAEWEHHQKLARDPRITWIGKIIRACSFDELPQFWNVFRGQMSVVGPRPMTPDQVDLYPNPDRSYFGLRPGITGPWQVSERHSTSFAERATFDEAYSRELSFASDLGLVLRTVVVVFRGTGC